MMRAISIGAACRRWGGRLALLLSVAAAALLHAPGDAAAFTLKLALVDGQPMTHGSACLGMGCLARRDAIARTDANGEIVLPTAPGAIVEYRRDGIDLSQTPPLVASGQLPQAGDRPGVALPRLLLASAPAVDTSESDLLARLNEQRAAAGLPPARLNTRMSAAADLQATSLARAGASGQSDLHGSDYGTTLAFRFGEVSMPEPEVGGEVVADGATPPQAVSDWMGSPAHRAQVLSPGVVLMGVARVGSFTVVTTHPPCAGCEQGAPGMRNSTPVEAAAATTVAAPVPARAVVTGSSAAPRPACGRETLRLRRLASRGGRLRLQVRAQCLRAGAAYTLMIRQNRTGRVLATRRISRAGTVTVSLRPARSARSLRVRLKRDGRAIAANSLSLRR